MTRVAFDGFSIDLPEGWAPVIDDATFSEPEELPPVVLSSGKNVGSLHLSMPRVDDDEPTMASIDMEALVIDWGTRRGVAPLGLARMRSDEMALASGFFRVGDDFVQVWLLSDGAAVVEASYVCPWAMRYDEQREREAAVASIRIG